MDTILAELELDLREIKYLTNNLSNSPDKALIEVVKRRIKQIQSHLDALLLDMDNFPVKEADAENESQEIEEIKNNTEIAPLPQTNPVQTESIVVESNYILAEAQTMQDDDSEIIKTEVSVTDTLVVTLTQEISPDINLREAFTLNDTFRFSRELFNGDVELLNRTLDEIVSFETIEEVSSYLQEKLDLENPDENESLIEFLEQVRKYFA